MASISALHIEAKPDEIAETVLLPGDPLRAKFIAENFLENSICFNKIRNMLGFTGIYKGKRVSVMGGGMGMPSAGIYSYELFNFYDVKNIIRIGTAGSLKEDVQIGDIVIGMGACTDSNYASQFNLPGTFAPIANYDLLHKVVDIAKEKGIKFSVGNILSSDIFYNDNKNSLFEWKKMGILAVEMEAAAIYMNADRARKKAVCVLTISDNLLTGERLSVKERETGFIKMIEIALLSIL
ncbi:MAG: purine-nucleoside phosphorylase [Oscillospiraceae bacterium]|jgi:purine-nucleoside phosphorylase|nr:purine-nucleoside phosphorylase [Oscillospiraceae bacterium]